MCCAPVWWSRAVSNVGQFETLIGREVVEREFKRPCRRSCDERVREVWRYGVRVTRSGAPYGHVGCYHEAAYYGSDAEFLAIVIPFLEDGLAASEPTVASFAERNVALVQRELGATSGVTFVHAAVRYQTPATTIRADTAAFARYVAQGALQIRVVGDMPHARTSTSWNSWARYEAVVDRAYDGFPVWVLCPYDTRAAPRHVLDEVSSTHQHAATSAGDHLQNTRYIDPEVFLSHRVGFVDPIELTPPRFEMTDPTPVAARRAIAQLLTESRIDPVAVEGFELAVSEAVTNAVVHGRPPAVVRAWYPDPYRAVVTVTDSGPGITDPFAGLWPRSDGRPGGRGLLIAHRACADVSYRRDDSGFTIVLEAGVSPTPWSLAD